MIERAGIPATQAASSVWSGQTPPDRDIGTRSTCAGMGWDSWGPCLDLQTLCGVPVPPEDTVVMEGELRDQGPGRGESLTSCGNLGKSVSVSSLPLSHLERRDVTFR